ncbi:MFS transporter superfamily [Fusarium oxysporum f. sp. vasinfectum]|nr:MFS transporter superfamily [Fusarium oxysporum f. sp. vasinfectum]KAK2931363.1 MFS transporter superfamily [Fusarium oxysporum f. sp. vasinfectum]
MASSGNNGLFDSSDGAIHTDVDKKNFNVDQAADARSITSIPGFFWFLGCGLAALVGAFASLPILAKCRRRPVYIWAQFIGAMLLFLIGFVQLASYYYEKHVAIFAQGALMILWIVVYGAAISPISTVIMGEVPSNALRPKRVALSNMVQ